MKNRPIHENLDTSFVNLSALIKYLRRRQFIGSVRVELSGYEADVTLTAAGDLRVREHDRIAGRISEGEEALQRLLIRAREPGGIINVFQTIEENALPTGETSPDIKEIPVVAAVPPPVKIVAAETPHQNGNGNSKIGKVELSPDAESNIKAELPNNKDNAPPSPVPPLPFELSNNFEAKAKQSNLAPNDWQMLLNLTAELLNTFDKSLAEANLEFAAAFEKACKEIAGDYPFLDPAANIFKYQNGKITVRRQINAKLLTASINEILRRIMEKLGRNPKFSNVYLVTAHRILALIEKRRPLYDKFSITPQLAKIIGI